MALAKYEVLEELGHGGMATVYRAHDRRLGRDVALKVLHPHLRDSREISHRFATEAKAVAKLRHPNIVEVFDVSGEGETEQYLVVEFVRGVTLRRLLEDRGLLPPEVGACIAVEILGALIHAHATGVVHRDVKPENVLLEHRRRALEDVDVSPSPPDTEASSLPPRLSGPTSATDSRKTPIDGRSGERIFVKLTDFGIAKLLDAQGVTSTGQVLGSPAHMAPEQIEGADVDGRADVFGLGVLLYECMVGHLPFEGSNPAQVLRRVLEGIYASAEREVPTIGKVWSRVLDQALARKPEGRFESALVMREALLQELNRLGLDAPRVELECFFDDPDGWTQEHEKRLIGRLCELGDEARRRGAAVDAAADYNRALAYAPADPQLLRIVASMDRSRARRRFFKRIAPLTIGTLALGVGAFIVARAIRGSEEVPSSDPVDAGLALKSGVAPEAGAGVAVPARDAEVLAGSLEEGDGSVAKATPSASATSAHAGQIAVAVVKPKRVSRSVTVGSLRPPFGVHLAIDGQGAADPALGAAFSVDEKAHTLTFTCEGNMCEPRTITVRAGETDETVAVELRILPAKLLVEGNAAHTYGIEEMPYVIIGAGVLTEVPLRAGRQNVTVFDRSDPTRRKAVDLEAGKQRIVSLK